MVETAFYIVGIALVLAALLVTAVGLRSERFPGSGGLLGAVVVAFAALVGATATLAWISASDEHSEHAAEHAAERQTAFEERASELRDAVAQRRGGDAAADGDGEDGGAAGGEGLQVFNAAGCGGCHTLAEAGSTAEVGPDLDEALPGQSPAEVEESIVDPSAEITSGFPDQMPDDFEQRLSQEELDALVEFLLRSTS